MAEVLHWFSCVLEMEFDLDKALEDVPIHVEDPSPPPDLEKKPPGVAGELPSEEAKKLQHYTKLRPKRNKKTQSSRVPVGDLSYLLEEIKKCLETWKFLLFIGIFDLVSFLKIVYL